MIGDQRQRNKQNINKLKQSRFYTVGSSNPHTLLLRREVRLQDSPELREFVQRINTRGIRTQYLQLIHQNPSFSRFAPHEHRSF